MTVELMDQKSKDEDIATLTNAFVDSRVLQTAIGVILDGLVDRPKPGNKEKARVAYKLFLEVFQQFRRDVKKRVGVSIVGSNHE